jgi:hypothetical protein
MNEDSKNPLRYHPSKVSWAVAEFTAAEPAIIARGFVAALALLIPLALGVCFVFQVPEKIELRARVLEASPTEVRAPEGVAVKKVLVIPGQQVEASTPVFELERDGRLPASGSETALPASVEGVVTGVVSGPAAQVKILPIRPAQFMTADIALSEITRVQTGSKVKIWLGDDPHELPFDGQIVALEVALDETRTRFLPFRRAKIEVTSPDFTARAVPGQEARIEITTGYRRLIAWVAERAL